MRAPREFISAKWAALLEAAEHLSEARTLDAIIDIIRTGARGISGADGITFVRREGDHCQHVAEDAIGPLWLGKKFKLEECVSGWTMLRGEPALIPDIFRDPRVPIEAYRPTFVKSLLMVPAGSGEHAAAIGAYWAKTDAFEEDTVPLMTLLGRHVAAAVSRVTLTGSLEVLNRIGAAIAAERDLNAVVQLVTDAGVELTGADFGAFFYNIVDNSGDRYMLYALSGVLREEFSKFPMPRSTGIFAPTFAGEAIVRSDDIRQDPRYGHNAPHHGMPEGHLPVTSYLAVPVISRGGEVHGALLFGHKESARFTLEHERLILGIAGHAATAIDNVRLLAAADAEIAARRAAEAELIVSNARFRGAVDAVRGVLWTNTPEGRMEGEQAGWAALTGQTREEYSGFGWADRVHPDDRLPTVSSWEEAVDQRKPFVFEHRLKMHDGSWRNFAVNAVPVIDGNGQITEWVGVHTDITEQRLSEAALRELNATLETRVKQAVAERELMEDVLRQAQKMEAVGQLTGGIAHDFNNLLTIILGNMEMVARKLGDGAEPSVNRALVNAQRGAERAATLTQRLLAFARRQPLAPKPTDVGRLIAGMSDLLTRSLGETVSIETVSGAGLWPVEVDQNQLESALINLAVNARDAMSGSGRLTVEVQNTVIDRGYAAIHSEVAAGPYVVIAVTDTGAGMAPEVLARAFDPFFTTKEVGKGTGLGLSQVYGFVKQSGGHVKIYSEPGQGTSVKIYLPRFSGGLDSEAEAEPTITERGVHDETILVVEDDDDVRAYTVESLRELGYRVLEAHDGPSALRLLERQQAEIDLLFTDVVMPGMTGRELADAARKLYPHLLTVFSSGYTRNAIIHGGRLDQGIDFLAKPFTFSALASRVREVLDRGELDRILFLDADDNRRVLAIDLIRQLGFTVEPAGSSMEAMGKMRSSAGGFDVVVMDHDAIAGELDGLIRQIHAVRKDLPVLIAAETESIDALAARHTAPCIGFLSRPYDSDALRAALGKLSVRCRHSAPRS
jgi:PAS domain S-box-containing protein